MLDLVSGVEWSWALLRSPYQSIATFMDAGGWVLRWILLANVLMWALVVERLWFFLRVYPMRRVALMTAWLQREDRTSWLAQQIRRALISQTRQTLDAGLSVIRVMVPMCPLLGLLGTVIGMLEVFDAMIAKNGADIRAMAYGVSHAMVATMAGITVSLIAMLCYNRLSAHSRREADQLVAMLPLT